MNKLNQKIVDCLNINDGRILYRYRLLQDDYVNLKNYLAYNNQVFENVENVTRYSSDWDKLFVLYASEWLRRDYQGGNWRWEDILSSIDMNVEQLSHANLMKITEQGLKKWQRQLFVNPNTGARQALGTLMREGGLAINYLNTTGGWIKDILIRLIKNKIENQSHTITIEKYSSLIPISLCREEVIQTLHELTDDIYDLVTTYQLDEKLDPINYLNQNIDGWQNSFPFSLEEQSAQELIRTLIMDSVREQSEYNKRQSDSPEDIRLKRQIIINTKNQLIQLKGFIELPRKIVLNEESFALVATDTLSVNFFKRTIDSLDNLEKQGDLLTTRSVYPVSNQKALVFKDNAPILIQEENWQISTSIQILTPTGEMPKLRNDKPYFINPYQNFSMYEIDVTIPFLAEIEEENEQIIATYVGSGSWKSKKPDALVYLPHGFEPNMADFPHAKLEKLGAILQGQLFKLTGEIQVISSDKTDKRTKYILKTNSLDANYLYEIRGQQLLDFVYPKMTFRGDISIYKIDMSNFEHSKVKDRDILIRAIDSMKYQTLADLDKKNLFGSYQIRVKADNQQIVFQQIVGLVPHNFRYTLRPQSKALSYLKHGEIEFISVSPADISISDVVDTIEIVPQPTNSIFDLSAVQIPTTKMTVCIYPKRGFTHKNNVLKFKCYFPTSQIVILDDRGKPLSNINNILFNINDNLYGYRIKIYNALIPSTAKLSFYLKSQADNRIEYDFSMEPYESKELEPYTWTEEIRKLLSFSNIGLNDSVIVQLTIQNRQIFSVRFVYYELEIQRQTNQLTIKYNHNLSQSKNFDNPELQNIENNSQLVAFNFKFPEDGVVNLLKDDKLWDLQTIDDSIEDVKKYSGTWLIFTEPVSLIENTINTSLDDACLQKIRHSIRPIAYTPIVHQSLDNNNNLEDIESNQILIDSLQITKSMRYVSCETNKEKRYKKMQDCLSKMAFVPNHEDWSYLKSLTQICINLPLTVLDNWQLAKYVPEFMLAVVIYQDFVLGEKICSKFLEQIGFHWELVNIHAFCQVWDNYRILLNKKFAIIDDNTSIIEGLIKGKEKYLKENFSAFDAFFTAKSSTTITKKEIIETIINDKLEELVKSKEDWVEDIDLFKLVDRLCEMINGEHKLSITLLNDHSDRKLVVLLPISLAWLACQKELSSELKEIHKDLLHQSISIYKVKQFDTIWFDEVFFYSLNWFNYSTTSING